SSRTSPRFTTTWAGSTFRRASPPKPGRSATSCRRSTRRKQTSSIGSSRPGRPRSKQGEAPPDASGTRSREMSDFSTIRFAVEERIATITLDRPDRLNAMNQAMKDDLRAAWTAVRDDPDVWAAIITGEGRAFSSGADVESLDGRGFRKIDRF